MGSKALLFQQLPGECWCVPGVIRTALDRKPSEIYLPSGTDPNSNNEDNQDGREGSGGTSVSQLGSLRLETPALRERGLVEQMEEAREAGLGGWFNGMDQELPES